MEVVPLTVPRRSDPTVTVGIPFNKRNVEEWSRLDRLTGMMETAKIETDHWSAMSNNAAHKYGKMVDSRERNNKDGTIHESQRKQMEVFQTQVPGGSMQVIRTQTVTTSSKSSKWVSSNDKVFSDLQLPINSLDLSSQKTKGSVGRSGSIGSRRPPSRPRSLIGPSSTPFGEETSKLCHQIHENAKNEVFKSFTETSPRLNGFGMESEGSSDGLVITDVSDNRTAKTLYRQKSCSNENVAAKDSNGSEVPEDDHLKRASKVRRSLQFTKTQDADDFDWSSGKSLRERAAEIENLLRRGGSSMSNGSTAHDSDKSSEAEKPKPIKRRDSFVTADTLKEVRERLKKSTLNDPDLKDDGIVTEREESKVKCFVYGMESTKASINGTGSLECRSSSKSSISSTKSAEWYRRRKSYGFEDVDESDKFGKFNRKSNIESSTDSGICQSSETVGVPSWSKTKSDSVSPTVVTVGARKKPEEKSVNSVYLDNPTVCSIRVDDQNDSDWKYTGSYSYNSPWNRKSPVPKREEILKSSLCSAKNPWISQLKGTKLVDRNWAADEQEVKDETENPAGKSALSKKEGESSVEGVTTQKKSKKVEFCKTEVHFAAESGKFNIVETDGKPPPNDIFRRRRRNVISGVPKNPHGLPETKFGDSIYEKRMLSESKTDSISEKIEAELKELSKIVIDALPQQDEPEVKKPSSKLYDVLEEDNEEGKIDSLRPRSILKNNGTVPRSREEPIPPQVWKSTVILRNKRYDTVRRQNPEETKTYSSDGENELQVRIRNLRKTDPKWWEANADTIKSDVKRRSLPDDILLKQLDTGRVSGDEMPMLSVAERVKKVEELKSNNYSSKINFRSGEMTVIQNGSENGFREDEKKLWMPQKNGIKERATISCDSKSTSNPSVMRFSANNKDNNTDSQKYQTTRILINFQSQSESHKPRTTQTSTTSTTTTTTTSVATATTTTTATRTTTTAAETSKKLPFPRQVNSYGSWSPGMKRDLNRYFNDLKSTTLVRETINPAEDMPELSKSVHEIIDQFDSLSLPKKNMKEKRRKTMPINYKAPKEYTQSDLEEELKNFTENLDKDFRDIYEEEIESAMKKKSNTERLIRPVIVNNQPKNYTSSEDGSKLSSLKTSSKLNYESDDSDLLADEEVRSYMSAGQGGTDSDAEERYGSCGSRKSFDDHYKNLETNRRKEIKNDVRPVKISYMREEKSNGTDRPLPEARKVASINLKYEDDPIFASNKFKSSMDSVKQKVTGYKEESENWEKTSNASSNNSVKRERNSYLNVLSLSEKYSKYLEKSSNSSLDNIPEYKSESLTRRAADVRKIGCPPQKPESESRRPIARYSKGEVEEPPKKIEKEERKVPRTVTRGYEVQTESTRQRIRQSDSRSRSSTSTERKRVSHHLDRKKCKERTEPVITDELTRAADQILVAVNDYDDDSHLASSEDDEKSRRITRKSKVANLGTISEGKRVTKTETRRTSTLTAAKRNLSTQSSASSLESLSREPIRVPKACPKLKSETTKPMSSRATRLLQRATTRQAAMPQPSSSEDLPSYIELAKKRSLRRQKSSTSVKSTEADAKTRVKPRSKPAESTSVTRIRDKKTEKAKESTTTMKSMRTSLRTSRTTDTERSKSSGRKIGTEKLEEPMRKKRTHLSSANQDSAASIVLQRKKPLEKWKP